MITGGTGGLGVAVTREALARGAEVTVPYVDDEELTRLDDLDPDAKKRLTLVKADLSNEDEVAGVVTGMAGLDALVHLVGGFTMGPTHEVTLEAWRAHHDLTLTTTFLCCKHALRRMRESGYGRIVTIGSKAADVPMGQMAAYSAAKAGVADAHKRAYKALDLVWEDTEDTDEDVRNACGEALQELGHGVW